MNITASYERPPYIGGIAWIVVYASIIFATFAGNILTIIAIFTSRQLATVLSNRLIFSLAFSDLFVGTTVPYHMCFYLVDIFDGNQHLCIVRFVLIAFACGSSIMNLLLIAGDRYVAIVYPLRYVRYVTKRTTKWATIVVWCASLIVATIPTYWNRWRENTSNTCEINQILPSGYTNWVLTPMFVTVWITMIIVYVKIWREASEHAKRMRTNTNRQNGTAMVNDTKSIQVVMLTLGCFSICWMPYVIIITIYRINGISSKTLLYELAFTLAVTNSGMNPMIYAWKNSNFRTTFWLLLRCRSPNSLENQQINYITNHTPSGKKKNDEIVKKGEDEGYYGDDEEKDGNSVVVVAKEMM